MVREESDGTYTLSLCSTRLRKQKAIRSNSKSDSLFSPAINICSKSGITEIAVFPNELELIGTLRQPRIRTPSSMAISAISLLSWVLSEVGSIKNMPVAYLEIGGKENSTTDL